MLELLLSLGAKKSGVTYPESGPGTKILQFGDTSAGYFGEVSGAELMTNQGVWGLADVVGSPNTTETTWLKFFIDNKVIFVAKKQIGIASWNAIYAGGAVFGVRGVGVAPSALGEVDQFRLALIPEGNRKWPVKLRLMRGLNADVLDSTANENSEWTRLMYHMWTGGTAPIWAQNTLADLMGPPDLTTVMLDTWSRSANYTVSRGSTTALTPVSTIPKTQSSYWRPVFELIDANNLAIDPQEVVYFGDGPNAPSIVEVAEDPSTVLKDPADVRYGVAGLKEFGMVIADSNVIPQITLTDWGVSGLKEFGVSSVTL